MLSSNNCIDTIGNYPISLVFFVGIFNVIRETLITCLLQTTDRRKLRKTWVSKAQDMSLTENSNKAFLPGVGEHDSFSYAICKVNICNFCIKCSVCNTDEQKYISQMSAIDVYDTINHLKFK